MRTRLLTLGSAFACLGLVSSPSTLAATATATTPVGGWAGLLQVIGGLLLVALLLAAGLYLLKRLTQPQGAGRNPLRIISATSVGPRERVAIIEIENTWLVLGITPGQISRLHELPRPAAPADALDSVQAGMNRTDFASRLRQIMEYRHGR